MCGIIGFVGGRAADEVLLYGLERLEYRGYDSAGIAILEDNEFFLLKTTGRIESLRRDYQKKGSINGTLGIGHTRWATHGEPCIANAHPHLSADKRIAVVHNGIIENSASLRKELEKEGVVFHSQTDSEVIPNLISKYYDGDLLSAVTAAVKQLEGSFALGIISTLEPEKLVAIKKFSPLVVGLSENENYIASDVTAIINGTNKVLYPDDCEPVVLTPSGVTLYSPEGTEIKKTVHTLSLDVSSSEKGGYEHFMMKEIMEQPEAIRQTIESRITGEKLIFEEIPLTTECLKSFNKINIVACGSAYHAGVAAKYLLEKLTRLPVETELASEFRYRNPIINSKTLTIAISQSGETADTLAAVKEAKSLGSYVISVVNVVGSSIAKESSCTLYTRAGPEIAVATTKGYSTQVSLLYLFGIWLAGKLGSFNQKSLDRLLLKVRLLPDIIDTVLKQRDKIKDLAKRSVNFNSVFFIGRNIDYAVALEASLKLKEISYIHSEAYAAGELKHGTISLIEENTPVVALACFKPLSAKLVSNIKEVKARGAYVISCTTSGRKEIREASDDTILVPATDELLCALPEIVPFQLFAYYVSVYKGLDVDKPRNLAKSVTVE
ncbi:MAG: glutamine--fructose-6-phosphate transaminase (isomerizing) [Clostridia bacterium]|nr:glutamine--fructose-6-phosphate transaminase (isomerizing) [Clostridia bacterium]